MSWIGDLFEGFRGRVGDIVRSAVTSDVATAAADARASIGLNTQGRRWSMLRGSGYSSLARYLEIERDLFNRYLDYEEMDEYPPLSTALDIYADEATQPDQLRGHAIWAVSESQEITDELNHLLHKILKVEEDLWGNARVVAKYGNNYAEILADPKYGVVGLAWIPPAEGRRIEDERNQLIGFVQTTQRGQFTPDQFRTMVDEDGSLTAAAVKMRESGASEVIPFESWEVIHWRIRGRSLRSPYGDGILEAARWIWKRLILLEDAALLHKLTKAPSRWAFYVETGDLSPPEALAYIDEVRHRHKKRKFVNAKGNLDFRTNPLGVDEDFWIPVRNGQESTRIDTIQGPDYQAVDDMRYFRQYIVTAIKTPATYIGLAEGGDDARAALTSQDVRFAKTTGRLQTALKEGYRQACRVHLSIIGVDPDSVEWDLVMPSTSSIFELAQMEVRNAQADLASRLAEYVPKKWILINVFKFAEDEADALLKARAKEQQDEAMRMANIQSDVAAITGEDPGDVEVPGAEPQRPETGADVGTGDTSPSPDKGSPGRPADEADHAMVRWRHVISRSKALLS